MSDRRVELEVRASSGAYGITIGLGTFDELLAAAPAAAVVTADERFRDAVGDRPAVFLAATEANKTLAEGARLIEELNGLGVRRGTALLAVGGGIIQDVATFVAQLYMRGLPWSYVPTTLASMADSCIGGKSSINVGAVKNLAGSFWPPASVTIDPAFIGTLDAAGVVNGLAEAAKIAYCRGAETYAEYERLAADFGLAGDLAAATPLLEVVLRAKTWFIEVDEFDKAERRLLNLGHTFGHALEAAVGHRVQHGVGVALGTRAAIHVAREEDGATGGLRDRLDDSCAALLRTVPGLAGDLAAFDPDVFRSSMLADKKHTPDELRLILPAADGGAYEFGLPHTPASIARITGALGAVTAQVPVA